MTLNSVLESEGNGRVWTGCEAAVMGDTGHRPLNDPGMDPTHNYTQDY